MDSHCDPHSFESVLPMYRKGSTLTAFVGKMRFIMYPSSENDSHPLAQDSLLGITAKISSLPLHVLLNARWYVGELESEPKT